MNELYDSWASDNSVWKLGDSLWGKGPWMTQSKLQPDNVFEAASPEQMAQYQALLKGMRERAERKRLAEQLVDTDLPLDDLLENIDEVREFLKHLKSLKQ